MPEAYEVSDEVLLGRAVKNARDRRKRKGLEHPRWSAVADLFAVGQGYSRKLCERFDLDPDQMVER